MISNYDKGPFIRVREDAAECWEGWNETCRIISEKIDRLPGKKKVVAMECYQGVDDEEVLVRLQEGVKGMFHLSKACMLPEEKLRPMLHPDVTDDEVFGRITRLELRDLFDGEAIGAMRGKIDGKKEGVIIVYGPGAALVVPEAHLVVYFDMPRWEGQLRFRRNEVANLGFTDKNAKAALQYKQAFFVDWRVCDRHKKMLMDRWDLVVDTTIREQPKLVTGAALNKAYGQAVSQPFRLVPFFDPGPWGGQWMKQHCGLDGAQANYAWCFDCVPEENSLLLRFNDILFETPGINLVFAQSRKLLGDAVQARFGDEFPIRFDFLDTMGGGNLSLQVHPTTEYIREHFGMQYTQDESYYMLDAGDDACVYLGLKDGISPAAMICELEEAQDSSTCFDAEKYVARWPVKKHDHVLIPAGTVHCSGRNSMVLEISATPYIFTFKLWDWGRMGLDGKPRPINIGHGKHVIDWTMTPERTKKELINTVETVAEGEGWREERTGLHEREFIETRRHWFTDTVVHQTNGSVHVLNLVEGREVLVESPSGAFEPFVVHYAETFVVPEFVKEYSVTPYGESAGKQCATMKAYVRKNP
ncbi:class I mannose-6-phosphate isomerase [Flavitalea sp. BT771]|uniref:class I mannose-6-phosphate isomerase n=1 Tax=Flavitalea sp. BT771 TaxID=3063329 RepID=UPI0026E29ABB|nr:class I mannose-6-phosphate isomerase [Flavitalea sp. BT771]MDO6432418.1 class I mannose-6-phosphate isomerase [Flavitalea sp. BT771]MDV6221328.1 class I mannose-6-phosphate isomerase [Flavitalea sp. BT771]